MAARELNLPVFFSGVAVLGAAMGTALYWLREAQEEDALEKVMAQQTGTNDVAGRQSVDITAPPPEALAGLPAYPNAVPKRVADSMKGQGTKMAVAWFTTDDYRTAAAATFECLPARETYDNTHQVVGGIGVTSEYGMTEWTMRLLALHTELGGRRAHARRVAASRAAHLRRRP